MDLDAAGSTMGPRAPLVAQDQGSDRFRTRRGARAPVPVRSGPNRRAAAQAPEPGDVLSAQTWISRYGQRRTPGFAYTLQMEKPSENVRVEVVELDNDGSRQIAPTERLTAQLSSRRDDIQAAVALAVDIVQNSASTAESKGGWRVSEVEASFGLTLTAEAGVIVSRASAEAAFEVTITVSRDGVA